MRPATELWPPGSRKVKQGVLVFELCAADVFKVAGAGHHGPEPRFVTSWGNAMSATMVVATNLHYGSQRPRPILWIGPY